MWVLLKEIIVVKRIIIGVILTAKWLIIVIDMMHNLLWLLALSNFLSYFGIFILFETHIFNIHYIIISIFLNFHLFILRISLMFSHIFLALKCQLFTLYISIRNYNRTWRLRLFCFFSINWRYVLILFFVSGASYRWILN